ncbi:MAG: hypothetical protein ACI4RR_08710 [Eubacterium sp.]
MKNAVYLLNRAFCYCMAVLLSFTLIATAFFLVSSVTIGNVNFTARYFNKSSMTQEMSERLYSQTDKLCERYKIESEVIRDALDSGYVSSAQVKALKNIYAVSSSRISRSIDTEARCLNALNKYEEKSGKSISDKDKEEITAQVMDCVDEVFTVVNIGEFGIFAKIISQKSVLLAIAFAFLSAIIAVIVFFTSSRSRRSLNYIAMALVTAGDISVVMTGMFIIEKPIDCLSLTNIQAYNNAIEGAVGVLRIIMIALGVLFIVAGAAIFITNYQLYSVRLRRSDLEHEIEKNLI